MEWGGCTHRWCRALLLSTTEPENIVFALVTECCITQYILLILSKPNTSTSRWGWIYQNKAFLQYVAKDPTDKHRCFKGKNSNLVMIVLQWHQTSCGGSGSDLRQLKGPGTETAEKDRTGGHPWGEIYRLQTIPSPRLSVKASVPLLSKGTILMEKSAKWRETRVGGKAESDGERRKKDSFVSAWWFSLNKNEQLMKKRGMFRDSVRERIK